MSDKEAKDVLKEALKEWLDDKYAEVGKWAVRSIAVAALGALAYFVIHYAK